MSEYSGKCDLRDTFTIGNGDILGEKTDIYVNGVGPIRNTTEKELIPYFPYIVTSMVSTQDHTVINLSKESYIDTLEREYLNYMLDDCLRVFRKCKRKKESFTLDKVKESIGEFSYRNNENIYTKLVNRIIKFKEKASIEGLHTSTGNFYRRTLYNTAVAENMTSHPIIMDVRRAMLEYEDS